MHFCQSLCIFSVKRFFCPFFLMLWKLVVDSFQAGFDFFLPHVFENKKLQAMIENKTKKDSSSHEDVKYVHFQTCMENN